MIRIICVGKLKDNLREISQDYIKRIKFFTKIEIIELNEYNSSSVKESLKKESERVLKKIDKNFIALDDKGKQFNSEEFSNLLKESNPTFVVGGHMGLDDEVKSKASSLLSFSKMTLPHQLTRIILLEQIYRGFTILNRQPYHK